MVNCIGCKFYSLLQGVHVCELFRTQTNSTVDECTGRIENVESD